jgi:hypothetical protein
MAEHYTQEHHGGSPKGSPIPPLDLFAFELNVKKRVLRGDADVEGGGAEEGDSDNDKDDGPKWVPKHARDVFDPEFTPFLIVNGVKSVSGTQCDECGYCTPSVIYMKKHLREKHFKEVIRGSTDTKPSQRFNTLLVIETNDATHPLGKVWVPANPNHRHLGVNRTMTASNVQQHSGFFREYTKYKTRHQKLIGSGTLSSFTDKRLRSPLAVKV